MASATLRGMNLFRSRGLRSLTALAAIALLAAGCASSPGAVPGASKTPTGHDSPHHDHAQIEAGDVDAAWLDDGRMIGIVTWGSSTPTCWPAQAEATSEGQTVTVRLTEHPEASEGCDADLTPHGSLVAAPAGVDVTKDVEIEVRNGSETGSVTLPGLPDAPQSGGEQTPSAGWFGTDGILLLTWGSGSCKPQVGDVEMTDAGATVTFTPATGMCTMDFVPRATPILLPEPVTPDADFTLTLVGDNLDGALPVIG